MNKLYLFAIALLVSCSNGPENIDSSIEITQVLDGWEITKSPYTLPIYYRDLFFLNPEVGFVAGSNGDIYRTTNSGESWQKQNSGTTLHILSIFFLNENIGIAGGQAGNGCLNDDCGKGSFLLKTINGGETWTKHFFTQYYQFNSLKFFDEFRGLAIIQTPQPDGNNYHLAKTSDGGASWQFIDLDVKQSGSKLFIVDNVIFIAGKNQKIYKSNDSGSTWTTIHTPIEAWNGVRGFYFYNENIGFLDGTASMYKTTDGGLHWEKISLPFSSFDVTHFYNENEGFNIDAAWSFKGNDFPSFDGSVSYQTSSGGENWKKSDKTNSLCLGIAYFPRRDLGYSIDKSGFYTIKKKN